LKKGKSLKIGSIICTKRHRRNELRKTTLQNLSINVNDRYKAQRKITSCRIRKESIYMKKK